MEDGHKVVKIMSATSFASEIMLVLMGLSGIAVVGVHIGYFSTLPYLLIGLGLFFGSFATVFCMLGIYVLLYQDYRQLKVLTTFLTIFLGLQLASIIHLYVFTNNMNSTEQNQGSIISLDVCFGSSACALVALILHLKQKGSTIEMVKL
ncbi:unnamed protein product [Adineta ricciae]|uniref:Uncharacterized protein n=1 Tax=Adineta ricciae TaxID=249248 RepID=A0A815DIC0_ADIRI|nr:unnamed protein product [Adineta ricciae]CAF1513031.1 unnamed protein product [Adineta ricciae]